MTNPMHQLEELAIPGGAIVQMSFTKAEAQQLLREFRAAPEPSACNCGCKVPDGHHWQCPQYKPAVKSGDGL